MQRNLVSVTSAGPDAARPPLDALPPRTVIPARPGAKVALLVDYENLRLGAPRGYAVSVERMFARLRAASPACAMYVYAVTKNCIDDYVVEERHGGALVVVTKTSAKMGGGNVDVELTLHATELDGSFDAVVLASGDSDFVALLQYFEGQGRAVGALSLKGSTSYRLRSFLIERHRWIGRDVLVPESAASRGLP